MKPVLFVNHVKVRPSPIHGYGVFAEKRINKGEIVEECYFLLTQGNEEDLEDYYFDVEGSNAILLGYGSIYNHADQPNTYYRYDTQSRVAIITAKVSIEKGEEIFISYGEGWFESRRKSPVKPSIWHRWLDPKTSIIIRGALACGLILGAVHFTKWFLS